MQHRHIIGLQLIIPVVFVGKAQIVCCIVINILKTKKCYYSRYSKKAKISIRNNISIRLSEYKDEELKWHIKHLDNRMIDMKLDWKDEKYIFFDLCIECWENTRNRSCIHSFCKKCCKCKLCPVH